MPATNYHKLKHILSEPDEQILNTLGNHSAEAYAATGKLKKGFAVLTNKRIYFKGKCFIRSNHSKSRRLNACTVELKDITATRVVYNRSLAFHIIALILLAAAIIVSAWEIFKFISGVYHEYLLLNIALPWLFALAFTVFDQMLSYRIFKLTCTTGSITFDLPWISRTEAEVFQKTLHRAIKNDDIT